MYTAMVRLRAIGETAALGLLRIVADRAQSSGARSRAVDVLIDLRPVGLLPILVDALKDGSVDLRWSIAKALGSLKDPSAIPVLEQLVSNDRGEVMLQPGFTVYVRDVAIEALAKLRRG